MTVAAHVQAGAVGEERGPWTAVQLCTDPRCELLHGQPHTTLAAPRGPVALFAPHALVAYTLHADTPRLFLFRTGAGRVRVPGVFPAVDLLLALQSARVLRRAARFFACLRRLGVSADQLPDALYHQLDRTLRARSPLARVVDALLASTCPHVRPMTRTHHHHHNRTRHP